MKIKTLENIVVSSFIGFGLSIIIWLLSALIVLNIENVVIDIDNFFSQLLFWTNTLVISGIVYWLDFTYSKKVK